MFLDNADYFTERNYIVADELEEESLRAIYQELLKELIQKLKGRLVILMQ